MEPSPFATTPAPHIADLQREGSVRFLLVSGERDEATWGIVGAFWLADEGDRGGFLVAPDALWTGSEMVRSYRGALARAGPTNASTGIGSSKWAVPGRTWSTRRERASGLFLVARRVGSI